MTELTQHAFRELFERHRDDLFRFLYRLTRNATDADDLLQETFLVVWRKRAQFDSRGSLEGWLKRIAFRTYLNSRTRSDRRARLGPMTSVEQHAYPDGAALASCASTEAIEHRESIEFLVARVREAVGDLPDGARETFVLFRCEGLSCSEIAAITETPLKTVETRLARATKLLAERLRPYRSSLPAW